MESASNLFVWHEKSVQVSARPVARYLGLTASIDVEVGCKPVLATGGKLRMSGDETSRFDDERGTHIVQLRWRAVPRFGIGLDRYQQPLKYQLRVDGELVADSTVYVNYLPIVLAITVVIVGACLLVMNHNTKPRFDAFSEKIGEMKKH